MMGANWRADLTNSTMKKFAFFPVKATSGKRIWLDYYYFVEKYLDNEMSHPIRSNTWTFIYTKNEWLVKQLKGA